MIDFVDSKEKVMKLREGSISCYDNVSFFLSNIEKSKDLNIFLEVSSDLALKRANFLDDKRSRGEKLGKLFGLVFAVKSNISVRGMSISCASKTLDNYKGSFNADVIDLIEKEDGILVGVLNNDEFASGSSGESSAFFKTLNPRSLSRIPGGSSSGAGASIGADLCDVSLGTDTGGSIRNPASHCGVVGVKPSYGRVSRYGAIDLSMSLDQIGPLAKDVYLCELTMEVISGKSINDPTTFDWDVEDYSKIKKLKFLKIGIIEKFEELIEDEQIKKIYLQKLDELKKLGHKIIPINISCIDLAIQAYYPIVYTEFFSGTRKFDGIKYGKKIEDSCGPEVLRRILGGKEISRSEFDGSYYKKALKVKDIISTEFQKAFDFVDLIFSPVTPMLPHIFGTNLTTEQMYAYDAFTIPANLAGICAGVVSKDFITLNKEKIYVGMQLMANKGKENLLFAGLEILEKL